MSVQIVTWAGVQPSNYSKPRAISGYGFDRFKPTNMFPPDADRRWDHTTLLWDDATRFWDWDLIE